MTYIPIPYNAFSLTNIYGADLLTNSNVEIKSFNSNLGSGGTESSLDLEFVLNQCEDSAYVPDILTGDPIIFSCGTNFSFGGIVRKIEKSQSASGISWKMSISDPRKLLDSVKLILNGYYCPIVDRLTLQSEPNIINVQNLLEGNSVPYNLCVAGINQYNPGVDLPKINEENKCLDYGYGKMSNGRTAYYYALVALHNKQLQPC